MVAASAGAGGARGDLREVLSWSSLVGDLCRGSGGAWLSCSPGPRGIPAARPTSGPLFSSVEMASPPPGRGWPCPTVGLALASLRGGRACLGAALDTSLTSPSSSVPATGDPRDNSGRRRSWAICSSRLEGPWQGSAGLFLPRPSGRRVPVAPAGGEQAELMSRWTLPRSPLLPPACSPACPSAWAPEPWLSTGLGLKPPPAPAPGGQLSLGLFLPLAPAPLTPPC